MSEEILIQNLDPDEVVVLDPDNCEELLLGVDSIVILSPSSKPLVTSVNGQTGPVVLGAADVDADPAGTAATIGASKANVVHGHVASDVAGLVVALAQVEANRLAILSKADQTALNALALIVDTKADQSAVTQQIADLVDTDAQVLAAITALGEALADDQDLLDALEYAVANRVRFDVNNQTLTSLQKSNARTNISAEEVGVAALLIAQITAASIGAATATQGAKADAALAAIDAPAAVRGTALTGLSTATATPITAADSVLSAAGKLQAQISASSGGGSTLRKFPAGFWANQRQLPPTSTVTQFNTSIAYMFFLLPHAITINQIGYSFGTSQHPSQVISARFYDFATGAAATPQIDLTGGGFTKSGAITPQTLQAGAYVVAVKPSYDAEFFAFEVASCPLFPTVNFMATATARQTVLAGAALPATFPSSGLTYGNSKHPAINFFVSA